MLRKAEINYQHLRKLRNNQRLIGKEKEGEVKIEKWSAVHEAQYLACKDILTHTDETHAVCEVRERKRNSTLGLLPTISELAEIINQPEIEQPELTGSDKVTDFDFNLMEEKGISL
jgi:hypothetical protein